MRYAIPIALVLVVAVAIPVVLTATRENQDDRDINPLSPPGAQQVAPGAIADLPERFFRQPVVVRGEVTAVGDEGAFALTGRDGTILVEPEAGLADVARGDAVQVTGVVNRVSRVQATSLGDLGEARTGEGAPFVSADALSVS